MENMSAFVLPDPASDSPTFAEITVPRIEANELLVQIKAVGVGIHDTYFLPNQRSQPYPIGIEGAGVVVQTGEAVAQYALGDRIAFVSSMQPKGGVWAEYAAVDVNALILSIPLEMTFEQAAAVPVAGNTALRAIDSLPTLPTASSLFIAGASGAIGTFAIQLARQRGWRVAASASSPNHDYMHSLGASLTVDYADARWPNQVRRWQPHGLDGALAIQPNTTAFSASVVKHEATIVTVSGDTDTPEGVKVVGLNYQLDVREKLQTLLNDIVAGNMLQVLDRIYSFSEAPKALQKVQSRHARGKSVISMQ